MWEQVRNLKGQSLQIQTVSSPVVGRMVKCLLRYVDTEIKLNFVLWVFSSSSDHFQIMLTRAADQETTSLCLKLTDILTSDCKNIGSPMEWA